MKKVISIIMAVVLLLTSSLGCAEGVVKLPAKLVEIETEAFSGDSSLTVADVPYGTQSISSRAFADSALEKIYIPNTVSYIAEDAFDGTDVLICSPDFSYAQTYAEQHGFEWEDCGDHYPLNVVDTATDILGSGFQLDGTELTAPELLPTEGETDPERLKLIEEYNALVLEEQELIAVINDTSGLDSAAEELSGMFEAFSVEETEKGVEISLGSNQLMLDSSLYGHLQAGDSFTDAELSADGTQIKLKAGNKEYILQTSGNTLYLSTADEAAVSAAMVRSRSADSLGDKVFRELDEYLKTCSNGVASLEYYVKLNLEHLEPCLNAEQALHEMKWKLGLEAEGVYDGRVAKIMEKIDGLKRLEGVLKKLSIGAQITSGYSLIAKWNKLKAIDAHGHPTVNDITPEALETTEKLLREVQLLKRTYCVAAANTMMGLATSISTVASAVTAVAATQSPFVQRFAAFLTGASAGAKLLSFVAGVGLGALSDYRYDLVKDLDDSLHTTVSGKVYDAVTQMPIQYVSVVGGGQQVWTDSTGAYTIYLLPGEHTITFKRDGYQNREITVTLESGEDLSKDIELSAAEVTLTGVIYDSETGSSLPSVTILCGDRMELSGIDGSYSISLPVGEHTLSYMLDGYEEQTVTLMLEEGTKPVQDVRMKKKASPPTPGNPVIPPASSFMYDIYDFDNNGIYDPGDYVQIESFMGAETDIIIPAVIDGFPVTGIYEFAFDNCSSLTSVSIPDSVTEIGRCAFIQCSSLTSVTIPDGVTKIGMNTFYWCESLTSVIIPDGVTTIGESAFFACYALTNVTIPDSVTTIGEKTFYWCSSLTSVTIPDSVTSIGALAFKDCSSLTSITIGSGVTSIGRLAFTGCANLKTVHVSNQYAAYYFAANYPEIQVIRLDIPEAEPEAA